MQFEGKSVKEAIEKGLSELGISEEQADIIVIEEETKGLFGRVKSNAVVDIVKKEEEGCDLVKANEFVQKILDLMAIDAKAEVKEDGENKVINILSESSSSAIGYRGEVLDAIQVLAGAFANIGKKEYKKVVVDCENYREKRKDTLVSLAKKLEAKATEIKREVILEPMLPFERRIIHTALAESQTVTTRSDGNEPNRYVVIVPNDKDEFAKPYNAGRNGGDRKRQRNDRRGSNDRRRGGNGGRRDGRRHSSGGASGEKRKSSSSFGFGTYLGNSLKDE